jgi:predicted RND superfamily exporter protein
MCLIASIVGVVLRGQDNNILTQVGFIVLIGLASKNAILIVEFAKQLEDRGRDRVEAAVEAARLRLRPILMTSLAFIFGVTPMVWAVGAGAELRQTLGTAVFSGMIGVTAFGLIFTPVFYVVTRWFALRLERRVYTAIYFADGCHRQGDRPHPSVDRDGIALGAEINGGATPIAWPLPDGTLPEPTQWPDWGLEWRERAEGLGIIPRRR